MTGPEHCFFEIGVYRCSPEQHAAELEREKHKYLQQLTRTDLVAPESYANASNWFDQNRWYSWRYNEVVGWLGLYCLGQQIRGAFWFVAAKRVTRRGDKRFAYFGKCFELSFDPSQSDVAIRSAVLSAINRASRDRPLKGRHMDLESFLVASNALRWKALLGFE